MCFYYPNDFINMWYLQAANQESAFLRLLFPLLLNQKVTPVSSYSIVPNGSWRNLITYWLKKLRHSHPEAIRVIFLLCWAQGWMPTVGQEIISPPEMRLMFICGLTSSSRCSLDVLTWFMSLKGVWFGLQLTCVYVAGRTGRLGRGEQTLAASWL